MAAALRHLPAPRAAGGRGKAPLLSWLGGPGRRTAAAARPEEGRGGRAGAVISLSPGQGEGMAGTSRSEGPVGAQRCSPHL